VKFKPGESGNAKGRPKGTRNWTAKFRDQLSDRVPEVLEKLIEQAAAGDVQAARLILERTLPTMKATEQPVRLVLKGSPAEQAGQALAAMAAGKLAVGEAAGIVSALTGHARLIESDDLLERIEKLEERAKA
jgi:hypothetical protein